MGFEFDNEIDETYYDIQMQERKADVEISADNFCSKFANMCKDLEDLKFKISILSAELKSIKTATENIIETKESRIS